MRERGSGSGKYATAEKRGKIGSPDQNYIKCLTEAGTGGEHRKKIVS